MAMNGDGHKVSNINKINETTRVANENMNENQTKIQVEMETVMEIEMGTLPCNKMCTYVPRTSTRIRINTNTWKVAGRGGTVSESYLRK